jgi:hypothetical protein
VKIQFNKIGDVKENTTTKTSEIPREHFEKLYSNKLENLELDTCLDMYDIPKLNPEDIKILNRFIISNEIEAEIKDFSNKEICRIRYIHC